MHCRHVGRQADESHSSQWVWRSVSAQTLLRRRCSGTWTQTGKTHRWSDPAAVTLSGVTGHHCRANGAKVLWLLLLCRILATAALNEAWPLPNPKDLILTLNQTIALIKMKMCHPPSHNSKNRQNTWNYMYRLGVSPSLMLVFRLAAQQQTRVLHSESYSTVVLQDNSFEHWPLMLRRK